GPAHISVADVVGALARRLAGHVDVTRWRDTAVVDVRLPRVLVGFVAGGAMAGAGAAPPGRFFHPPAPPRPVRNFPGAPPGAVLAIYFHLARRAVWLLPACAFLGAAADAVLVFAIAAHQGRGRVFTATLLLVGVAVMALNVSLTTFILSISLASYDVGREVM